MCSLDGVLSENIRITAQVITEICQRNTRHQISDPPISRNQFYILNILAKNGEFPIGELARILDISTAAASKNIDRLVKMGFVSRRTNQSDRRSMEIELTDDGRKIVDDFEQVTRKKQRPMMENFTDQEKRTLLDYLRRIIRFTLAEEHQSDLICLQCGGACGQECVIESLDGVCHNPDTA